MRSNEWQVEGFDYYPDVLTATEEAALLEELSALPFREISMRGVTARRRVVCFGFDYAYAARGVVATAPVPHVLEMLKGRCAAVAGIPERLNQVIVSEYPAGAGIGWHTDAAVFGETIMGLSLGALARLQLRERGSTRVAGAFRLEPRSLYALRGQARWRYQHRVVPVAATRYSLTFREVVAKEA